MIINWMERLCVCEIKLVNTYDAEAASYPMKNIGRYRHAFIYTEEGTEVYHFKDKIVHAVPHSVLYIPKGEKYTIELIGERSTAHVFDFEAVFEEERRPFIVKLNKNNDIKTFFTDSEKIWKRKKTGYYTLCKANLYKTIYGLIQQESEYLNSDNYSVIATAVDFLHKHYLENEFKIEWLYEIAGISPKYFETLFCKKFKTTPKKYVITLKMEQAKEILLSEKMSVSDVAKQLGYCDVYHFSKEFKAKTGFTPSEYRKKAY